MSQSKYAFSFQRIQNGQPNLLIPMWMDKMTKTYGAYVYYLAIKGIMSITKIKRSIWSSITMNPKKIEKNHL